MRSLRPAKARMPPTVKYHFSKLLLSQPEGGAGLPATIHARIIVCAASRSSLRCSCTQSRSIGYLKLSLASGLTKSVANSIGTVRRDMSLRDEAFLPTAMTQALFGTDRCSDLPSVRPE